MSFLWFLSDLRTPAGDFFFQQITYLGQEIFVVAVICWLYWCVSKKSAYILGFSYFLSGLLIQALKITFRVPRPWKLDSSFKAVESALPEATGYSFPSGHTQSITALFGTLALSARKKWQTVLCFVIIFLVGFSRMYLGVHTPLDVSVSFALSLLSAILCWYIFNKKEFIWTKPFILALILGICSLLLCAYSLALNTSGTINVDYSMDCLKASGAGCAFAIGYYVETTRIRFEIADTWKKRILRFLIGGVVAGLLLKGIKPLIGDSLAAGFVRYFLTVIWVIAIYPFLFTRFEKKHPSE